MLACLLARCDVCVCAEQMAMQCGFELVMGALVTSLCAMLPP
jgi:hypothetical protein